MWFSRHIHRRGAVDGPSKCIKCIIVSFFYYYFYSFFVKASAMIYIHGSIMRFDGTDEIIPKRSWFMKELKSLSLLN